MESHAPSQLRQYLESVVNQFEQAGTIDPAVKEQLLAVLLERLDNALLDAALAALPDDKVPGLEQLTQNNASSDTIRAYFSQHIPNLQQVFDHTVATFTQSLVGQYGQKD